MGGQELIQVAELLACYQSMYAARKCDEYEQKLIRSGIARLHVGGGGSESACLANLFLHSDDFCYLHWRDRALRIARGISIECIADTFFGVSGWEGSDKNLTCHETRLESHIMPVPTPTPSHCLPATGAALSLRQEGSSALVVCSLGDGASRQGEFFEAIAFSYQYQLPILWVVLDNGFAISSRTKGVTAFDLKMLPGEICEDVEGSEPERLLQVYSKVTSEIRSGKGPRIVRLRIPRLSGHTSYDDHSLYRTREEIEHEKRRDPLSHMREWILKCSTDASARMIAAETTIADQVEAAYNRSQDTWLGLTKSKATNIFTPKAPPKTARCEKIADTVRTTLELILRTTPAAMILGEDIEDPLGGVFRLTKGLSTNYPDRVLNSPLAEATIAGAACGRATSGKVTIAEIQFMDFLAPAWNQLTSNIVTQRWRTDDKWGCPVVLYTVAGAYSPGEGMFHSQVNLAQLARNEDLAVAYPSNPTDVREVFLKASQSQRPTFVVLPKARLWEQQEVLPTVGFGKARRHCQGRDITIVTWGNGVSVCQEAVQLLPNVSVDLIDLCYINPMDFESIKESIVKTRHLLVVDEEHPSFSVGSDVIRQVVCDAECWKSLKKQPMLAARSSQFVPTSIEGERKVLPFPQDIVLLVQQLLSDC